MEMSENLRICAILRLVPDLVEGIEVDEENNEVISFMYSPSERDEHALEEAIIFKEKYGGQVEVLGIADDDSRECLDDALASAKAKGADNILKIILSKRTNKRVELAKAVAEYINKNNKNYDIIFTGIQAIDAFSGYFGGMLASLFSYSYVGGVVEVSLNSDDKLKVKKELSGGILAEYLVDLPAVIGVISAEKPLRFIPFIKLKKAIKDVKNEKYEEINIDEVQGVEVISYKELKPQIKLIEGDTEYMVNKMIEILKEIKIL